MAGFRAEEARRDGRDDSDRLDRSGMRDGGMMSFGNKNTERIVSDTSEMNGTKGAGIPAVQAGKGDLMNTGGQAADRGAGPRAPGSPDGKTARPKAPGGVPGGAGGGARGGGAPAQ